MDEGDPGYGAERAQPHGKCHPQPTPGREGAGREVGQTPRSGANPNGLKSPPEHTVPLYSAEAPQSPESAALGRPQLQCLHVGALEQPRPWVSEEQAQLLI